MKKTLRTAGILALAFALIGGAGFAQKKKAGEADRILKEMMNDDQMVALKAISEIRDGALEKEKNKFETAKNNLILLIMNKKKNMTIRMGASDSAAFFQVKKAIPALKAVIKFEGASNMAIKYAYQSALDRLEGRAKGSVYRPAPVHHGTPTYSGTPGFGGTPTHK